MKLYSSHLRPGAPPRLVAEGFSPGAMIFGVLWLLVQGAWIPGLILLAAGLCAGRLATVLHSPAPLLGLLVAQGLFGRDLIRWSLALRGYRPGPPVAGRTHDAAFFRLIEARPDLRPIP